MKKLLNILLLLTLTSLTSLSTVACTQQTSTFQIPFTQKENYVVQAINETQNKQSTTNFDPLTITDILDNPNISYKFSDKNKVNFNYDIKISQNANTFLNNHFSYRIPQVQGSFNLDLNNSEIKNNNISSINYLIGYHQNDIDNIANMLTGSTNDFTLIMNEDDWSNFTDWTSNSIQWNGYIGANAWLHYFNIYNANITLTNDQWNKILKQLKILDVPEGYAVCLHIIRELGKDFQVSYNNLNTQDKYNMPLPEEKPWLQLFSFSSASIEDGSVLAINNKFVGLNKDILKELIDIYTNNSDYHNSNWNIKTIIQLLQNNHFCKTNLDLKTVATCLFNNWNINLVNNFLASNHEYFLMQYDSNNKYIKNNWNM